MIKTVKEVIKDNPELLSLFRDLFQVGYNLGQTDLRNQLGNKTIKSFDSFEHYCECHYLSEEQIKIFNK